LKLFKLKYGIIPACDVDDLDDLSNLIETTCFLEFIQGYKIGMDLVVPYGIDQVTELIRKYTLLPIIYDHQKFGTDIPDICSGKILEKLKNAGIKAIIIFPQAGIETLQSVVQACKRIDLIPIVGGEMTHKGYFISEGGYIANNAPERMYLDAAKLGVEYFIIPGTKLKSMRRYSSRLKKIVKEPKFLFPGVGKGQGGDIVAAFNTVKPHNSYAIIGRGIYAEKNKTEAAKKLWENVQSLI